MEKYFLLKSFNSDITDEDLIIELEDDYGWLINFGCNLDNMQFIAKAYGDDNLVLQQSLLCINFNIYILSPEFRDFVEQIITVDHQWLDVDIFNSSDKLITNEYKILNIINPTKCINLKESSYKILHEETKEYIFYKLVVEKEKLDVEFGCLDLSKEIFVSENVKHQIERNKFVSTAFKEI